MLNKKILIVDDEPHITEMLAKFFTLEGFEPVVLNDPTKALDVIKSQNIMMVITDIVMPDIDGLELLRQVKKYDGLVQVIMITRYIRMGNILDAFGQGVNNIFFKPFESLDAIKAEVDAGFEKLTRIKTVLRGLSKYKDSDSAASSLN